MWSIFHMLKRVLRKLYRICLLSFSFPITMFLVLIFPFYKIKLICLFSDRIGHYAMNTELMLCYLDEIRNTDKKIKYLFYIRDASVSNEQLHEMWRRILPVLPCTKLASMVDRSLFFFLGDYYKNTELKSFEVADGYQDINGYLKKYKPRLNFTAPEILLGEKLLLSLSIPRDAKFVCVLVRDSAYLDKHLPGNNWSYHFYRDSDIQNFEKAAIFLADKGYYVIRMGKAVSKAFNAKHPNIIDYANHQARSDFADIYLSAHCSFFISTSAGLDAVSQIFRRPLLLASIGPFTDILQYWYPCKYFITKKIIDCKTGELVSFQQIDHAVKKQPDIRKLLDINHWKLLENTPEEILDAVVEMANCFDQEKNVSITNAFSALLKSPIQICMIADREFLRLHPQNFYAHMSNRFCEQNKELFVYE